MVPLTFWPPQPQGLSLGNYHIHDGWGSGIAQAIRAARIGGFDLMILTENNITKKAYCCNMTGYYMVCSQEITTGDCDAQGGVGMLVSDQTQVWSIELTCFHGMNVVICEVVTRKCTPIIRAYLPTSTLEHLPDLA